MELILNIVLIIIPVLLSMAFLTLCERKVLASIQLRKGPNLVGIWGILQPFADAIKLFIKETIIPSDSNKILFLISPIISLSLALLSWVVIPMSKGIYILDVKLSILLLLAISSLSVYGLLSSGWASNSKYSLIGGLRSTSQMISYEVALGLILLSTLVTSSSFNLTTIVENQAYVWNVFTLFPIFILFIISSLAETNRSPFDLPEAESELVSGFNIEYSSMSFALFFLAEYIHIILMSIIITIMFLGGWLTPIKWIPESLVLAIKGSIIMYWFIWVRGSYPRLRYDQLMSLVWKNYLPLSLAILLFVITWLIILDSCI